MLLGCICRLTAFIARSKTAAAEESKHARPRVRSARLVRCRGCRYKMGDAFRVFFFFVPCFMNWKNS